MVQTLIEDKNKMNYDIIRAKCGWRGKDLTVICRPDENCGNLE